MNLVHFRVDSSVHKICLIRAFDKALFILRILFSWTLLTLILSSVDIYQGMTTLLVFNNFKRVSLSF